MIRKQKLGGSDKDVIQERIIGTRSSTTNSRDVEETMQKKKSENI